MSERMPTPSSVPDTNGRLPSSIPQSLNNLAARAHFLYKFSTGPRQSGCHICVQNEEIVNAWDIEEACSAVCSELDAPLSLDNLNKAISATKTNSAPVPDGIPSAFLRHSGQCFRQRLLIFLNFSWAHGVFPSLFLFEKSFALWKKKGSINDWHNYRMISITPIILRLFERLVKSRLVPFLYPKLSKYQQGSLFGRGAHFNLYRFLSYIREGMFQINIDVPSSVWRHSRSL